MNTAKLARLFLLFIGISGAFSVLFGAWLSHGGQNLPLQVYKRLSDAHLYQFIHTLALLMVYIWWLKTPSKYLFITMVLFGLGIILFSGSLYIKTYFELMFIGKMAPWGGILLALAWLNLALFSPKILEKKSL